MQILTRDSLTLLEGLVSPLRHTNVPDLLVSDLLIPIAHSIIQPLEELLSICSPCDVADPLLGQHIPFMFNREVFARTFLLIEPGPQFLRAEILPLWDSHRSNLLVPKNYKQD